MKSSRREQQFIVDYMFETAPKETVEHLEKVYSQRVMGREYDIWNVHTDVERWWIITNPANLYLQSQFPHMDIALTFHIGLMTRVEDRQEFGAPEEQFDFFPVAWRKWTQAGEVFNQADEAEEFQTIGMICRESLVAFVKESAKLIELPNDSPKPKASDFLGWIDVIANTIAAGASAERRRGYLKAITKSTWEMVQWLTHTASAVRFDAYFAFKATAHVLTVYSLALIRFQSNFPDQCPECASYRLASDYRRGDDNKMRHFTVCEACGWEANPVLIKEKRERAKKTRRAEDKNKEDIGDCILVEVPLRGPAPPKPSK